MLFVYVKRARKLQLYRKIWVGILLHWQGQWPWLQPSPWPMRADSTWTQGTWGTCFPGQVNKQKLSNTYSISATLWLKTLTNYVNLFLLELVGTKDLEPMLSFGTAEPFCRAFELLEHLGYRNRLLKCTKEKEMMMPILSFFSQRISVMPKGW